MRTAIYPKLCYFLGVNCALSALSGWLHPNSCVLRELLHLRLCAHRTAHLEIPSVFPFYHVDESIYAVIHNHKAVLPLRGHLVTSRDICGCHGGKVLLSGCQLKCRMPS